MKAVRNRAACRRGSLMPALWGLLLVVMAGTAVQAQVQMPAQVQAGPKAIYGVTSLDVAPAATAQGVALLRQYREAARKQPGNQGVTLLQGSIGPTGSSSTRPGKDQSAYDANEKASHTAALRDRLKPIGGAPYDRATTRRSRSGPSGRRQAAAPSTCSCISMSSARHRCHARGCQGGSRGRPQGRRQFALRRGAIGRSAAKPQHAAGGLG